MQPERTPTKHDDPRIGRIGPRPQSIRYLGIVLRAAHQVGAAVFLAPYLLGLQQGPPPFYLWLVILSGVLLLAAEWWRQRQMYREISGLAVVVKMLIIGAAFHGLLPAVPAMTVAFVLASLVSHAPKSIRHRLYL